MEIRSKTARRRRSIPWLAANSGSLIPYFILILIMLVMSLFQSNLSLKWFNSKMDAGMTLALVSIGQTLVMMIGGTDLSVGGVICFTNCIASVCLSEGSGYIPLLAIGIVLIGVAAGFINGIIIVKLKLQSFIATLATWSIWYGLALCVLSTDGGEPADSFVKAMMQRIGGLSLSTFMIAGLVLAGIVFKSTRLGISILAVGSNEKGAHFGGIDVNRTKIIVYTLSGALAACAGLFRTAQVASGSPTAGNDFILLSCAAAVIGGANIATGSFSFAGAIAGAFIMRLLTDLMVFAGVSSYLTSVFQGLLLILAVGINSLSALLQKKKSMEVSA